MNAFARIASYALGRPIQPILMDNAEGDILAIFRRISDDKLDEIIAEAQRIFKKMNSVPITSPSQTLLGCKACQKYFSIATLAKQFELSEKTIRRMITEGRLKAKRIRGSIRIPHTELAKVIEDY